MSINETTSSICISIYVPLQRPGITPAKGRGRIKYMHSLQRVEEKLIGNSVQSEVRKEIMKPARLLLEDIYFWRTQNLGLAVFFAKGFFKTYLIPVIFRQQEFVGNLFYIQPLSQFISGDYEEFVPLQELKKISLLKQSQKI